jgi:hypothetical protein
LLLDDDPVDQKSTQDEKEIDPGLSKPASNLREYGCEGPWVEIRPK